MDNKEDREQPKALGNVTRLEFYTGIALVLLEVLFLAAVVNNAAERRLWSAVVRLERRATETDLEMSRQAGYILDDMERREQERESLFSGHSMRVIGVDRKAGTVRLELTAYLKEYTAGMEGTFFVYGASEEEAAIPCVFDNGYILRAEAELPLCKSIYAEVSLRAGGSEKRQILGDMEITESMITPQFTGRWKEFSHDTQGGKDTLKGVFEVEVEFPEDWEKKGRILSGRMLEVRKDGKEILSVPMESGWEYAGDPYMDTTFLGRIEEPLPLEAGCEIEFYFKAADSDGAQYACLVQKGVLDAKTGRYMVDKDALDGETLTIE